MSEWQVATASASTKRLEVSEMRNAAMARTRFMPSCANVAATRSQKTSAGSDSFMTKVLRGGRGGAVPYVAGRLLAPSLGTRGVSHRVQAECKGMPECKWNATTVPQKTFE